MCTDVVTTAQTIIERNNKNKLKTMLIVTDVKKAFDYVNINILSDIILEFNFLNVYIN